VRAISLWQPWASLWVAGVKIHETRHWPTDYRGPLLVHAAKRLCADLEPDLADIMVKNFGARWAKELPRGALVGSVELASCRPTDMTANLITDRERACGDWSPGRYAWGARQAYRFREPIPYTGRQGFFDVSASVVAPMLPGGAIAAPAPQGSLL
jgi:activating signal cointegrator 1